jgi:bleomycin hydrolase
MNSLKRNYFFVLLFIASGVFAQNKETVAVQPAPQFFEIKKIDATPVKNQANTGTCWCFSTVSLLESEAFKTERKQFDLSEMFIVRNVYIEKAKNYILRQGKAQFGEGALGHDMINAVEKYGAVPAEFYTGLQKGQKTHDHSKLIVSLQAYLDTLLKHVPVPADWLSGYTKILDDALGVPPAEFALIKMGYNNMGYTPIGFSKDVLHFNANDYISLTSFTHEPYYSKFILQVPDNFSNGSFHNLPLDELISTVKNALNNGYSVLWDADVSNNGFMQDIGLALNLNQKKKYDKTTLTAETKEEPVDAGTRQALYENLTTQDDHLMHIVGIEKSKTGKTFFVVKNSWGERGPYKGYINVSESYFALNTISIVLQKKALVKDVASKLHM